MIEALQFHRCIMHQVKQSPCLNSLLPERQLSLMVSALLIFFTEEKDLLPGTAQNNSSLVLSQY